MKKGFLFLGMLLVAGVLHANSANMLGAGFNAPTVTDKDSVYGPIAGEIVFDTSDSTFYGRTQMSTWISLGGNSSNGVEPGTIIAFAGATCPAGYQAADGSAISRSTYATLFAAIGTASGSGDGSTTFNVPDYRGRFLRGVDDTAGRDPDKASRTAMNTGGNTGNSVGSVQLDQLKSHRHDTYQNNGPGGAAGAGLPLSNTGGWTGYTGGNETRPTNAYVNYCVKL